MLRTLLSDTEAFAESNPHSVQAMQLARLLLMHYSSLRDDDELEAFRTGLKPVRRILEEIDSLGSTTEEEREWLSSTLLPLLPESNVIDFSAATNIEKNSELVSVEGTEAGTEADPVELVELADGEWVLLTAFRYQQEFGCETFQTRDISNRLKFLFFDQIKRETKERINVSRALNTLTEREPPWLICKGEAGKGTQIKRKLFSFTEEGLIHARNMDSMLSRSKLVS